jgi:hypothetical protein
MQLAKLVAGDLAHPPLFYVLLKLWSYVVDGSVSSLRVFTFAVSTASIAPLIALGRELRFQTREIALALFLMSMSNYLVIYSYILRGYCLLLFFSICSLFVFVRGLRSNFSCNRDILIIVSVNVLFVYVHYFAWLVVAAQYVWVLFTSPRSLRRFTMATVIVVLCFIPWIVVVVYVSTRVTLTIWDHFGVLGGPGLHSVNRTDSCRYGRFSVASDFRSYLRDPPPKPNRRRFKVSGSAGIDNRFLYRRKSHRCRYFWLGVATKIAHHCQWSLLTSGCGFGFSLTIRMESFGCCDVFGRMVDSGRSCSNYRNGRFG